MRIDFCDMCGKIFVEDDTQFKLITEKYGDNRSYTICSSCRDTLDQKMKAVREKTRSKMGDLSID